MVSSSKNTQKIEIRFYFIKDNIIRKQLNAKQCSTYGILAEFPSKTLQVRKFKQFKNKCMDMNKLPKESKGNRKLQRKCMISEMKNSTRGKQN